MDLLQEYSELKKTIDYHMDRYYNQDEPEISDYEYDKLMIRLKEIEKEHPEWVTSDSPSQKIGGTVKREAGVKPQPGAAAPAQKPRAQQQRGGCGKVYQQ